MEIEGWVPAHEFCGDVEDWIWYNHSRKACQRACIAFIVAQQNLGRLHKDVVPYIAQRFIWPTRVKNAIWLEVEDD